MIRAIRKLLRSAGFVSMLARGWDIGADHGWAL
jgi:hypothetical protein